MTKKVLISLSGGMDSVTLLGLAIEKGYQPHLVHFQYGSKHNPYEMLAINRVTQHYKLASIQVIDLSRTMQAIKSNLLKSGGDIPEGHYQASSMTQTVVPGRNLIFTSIAAAIAESEGIDEVWLGIHTGDHAIYPDCRETFYKAAKQTVSESTEGRVTLEAPFLGLDKAKILTMGYGFKIPVPYGVTRTCYKDQPVSCGRCGSCQERLLAFAEIGREDPIRYEGREILPKEPVPSPLDPSDDDSDQKRFLAEDRKVDGDSPLDQLAADDPAVKGSMGGGIPEEQPTPKKKRR